MILWFSAQTPQSVPTILLLPHTTQSCSCATLTPLTPMSFSGWFTTGLHRFHRRTFLHLCATLTHNLIAETAFFLHFRDSNFTCYVTACDSNFTGYVTAWLHRFHRRTLLHGCSLLRPRFTYFSSLLRFWVLFVQVCDFQFGPACRLRISPFLAGPT